MNEGPVASPSVQVCAMDASGAYCVGCHRTLHEIARWSAMTDPERREIVAKLDARRRRLAAATRKRCPRGGTEFPWGAGDPAGACWCNGYPPVAPSGPDGRCLCPACLSRAA